MAVSRPTAPRHQNKSRERKIQQTCFVEGKCPIRCSPPCSSLNQIKATRRLGGHRRGGPASSLKFLPVSFDPDNPLTNGARDAVLGGGRHPGEIPFQPELSR